MNNMVMLRIVVGEEYCPLVDRSLVASVDISAVPDNAGPVFFRGTDGQDVPWISGEWHALVRVDLGQIQVKGTPGDVITVDFSPARDGTPSGLTTRVTLADGTVLSQASPTGE